MKGTSTVGPSCQLSHQMCNSAATHSVYQNTFGWINAVNTWPLNVLISPQYIVFENKGPSLQNNRCSVLSWWDGSQAPWHMKARVLSRCDGPVGTRRWGRVTSRPESVPHHTQMCRKEHRRASVFVWSGSGLLVSCFPFSPFCSLVLPVLSHYFWLSVQYRHWVI
jgi:hypothetical protein